MSRIKDSYAASFFRKNDSAFNPSSYNNRNSFTVPNDIKLFTNVVCFILSVFQHVPWKDCVLVFRLIDCNRNNVLIASSLNIFNMGSVVSIFNSKIEFL